MRLSARRNDVKKTQLDIENEVLQAMKALLAQVKAEH
jgi:hypothetical protein